MNKNESRYFDTAEKMDRAFLSLLEKKEFAYITVKEICATAGVNRSTFYLHYETLEDLLSECTEYLNAKFSEHMRQDGEAFVESIRDCPLEELYLITPRYLVPYLGYVKEHKRLFAAAIKNTKALRLEEIYRKLFRFVFVPILQRFCVSPEMMEYMMAFYVQGLMAIITQWLKNDCRDTEEQLIEVMQKCTGAGNKAKNSAEGLAIPTE